MNQAWNNYFLALPNNFQDFFKKYSRLQKLLNNYLDNDVSEDKQLHFQNLTEFIKSNNIQSDVHDLTCFLFLLSTLTSRLFIPNHNYFTKIQSILLFYKNEIQNLPQDKLFKYFKSNNQILLFLYNHNIIDIFSPKIIDVLFTRDNIENIEFFYPEIKERISEEKEDKKIFANIKKILNLPFLNYINQIENGFIEKRKEAVNDGSLAEIIRNDSLDQFIEYKEKTEMDLNSSLPSSIFEGSSLLSNCHNSLIEYSAFYGSIQIFKYLYKNKAKLSNRVWVCAIYSENFEIIHLLEESKDFEFDFNRCFIESIRIHSNEIANYFLENHLDGNIKDESFIECLKSFNLHFIKHYLMGGQSSTENLNLQKFKSFAEKLFELFCIQGHFYFVDILCHMTNPIQINVNVKSDIFFFLFSYRFSRQFFIRNIEPTF